MLHTGVILALSLSVSVFASVTHFMSQTRTRANAFAEEKLRQRGIRVGPAPELQEPLEAPSRQPRIEEFFPRAVQG